MNELVKQIETAWMEYNAALVSRLHIKETKQALGNILINATEDILKALKAYQEPAAEAKPEKTPSGKKTRKPDEKATAQDDGIGQE